MSESSLVASTVSGNNSGTNKRKRRSSFDEFDIENQRPPSKKMYSSSGEDLDSASDIENDAVELDLYAIGASPQTATLCPKIDAIRSKRSSNNSASRSASNSNNNNDSNKNSLNNNDNQHKDSNSRNVNGQTATLTPINKNEPVHVTEMTPQNLKKTEPWTKCTKCNRRNETRLCPLPLFSWADAKDVWRHMCEKDKKTALDRSPKMLTKHQGLQPRMRAILLDWLNEVCDVYKLHRETYYLALDYLDRYLSTNVTISKTFLQLIGITCLFIASKVEEIYPPKLSEFAYVTDGACREEDILKQELIILSALKWQTNPITIIGWLGIYMQLQVSNRSPKLSEETPHKFVMTKSIVKQQTSQKEQTTTTTATNSDKVDDCFVYPQLSGLEYSETAQLLDLCTLDVGIANFPYSVIAAAAMSHTFNKKLAIELSGLDWATIAPCHRWMEPYHEVIKQQPRLSLQERNEQVECSYGMHSICPNFNTDDSYIIQSHTTTMDMFDQASLYREQRLLEASPAPMRTNIDHVCPPEGLLTPPDSSRKFPEPDSTYK